jgi:hypothetical protein
MDLSNPYTRSAGSRTWLSQFTTRHARLYAESFHNGENTAEVMARVLHEAGDGVHLIVLTMLLDFPQIGHGTIDKRSLDEEGFDEAERISLALLRYPITCCIPSLDWVPDT